MGLNVSFVEVNDEGAAGGVGLCHDERRRKVEKSYVNKEGETVEYETSEWWAKSSEEHAKTCEDCPLECEDDHFRESGFRGCYPRMGSYGYVASLADYCQQHGILRHNAFVLLTEGGGFDKLPKGDLPDLLGAIRECREELEGRTTQAGVPYKDGERAGHHRPAQPAQSAGFGYSWFYGSSRVQVGVHYDKGIARITDSQALFPLNPFGEVAEYFQETSDPEVLEAFSDRRPAPPRGGFGCFIRPKRWKAVLPDVVRFEEVPVRDFEHLFKTFERIARIAIEHGLTVEGC
jgi:hypothetical protein